MAINDIGTLSALRSKMQWHQERQRVLAQNVANSDTPGFKPRDLVEVKYNPNGSVVTTPTAPLPLLRTSSAHQLPQNGTASAQTRGTGFETRPAGNAVNLEDEMQKTAANQMDFAAATALYSRNIGLLKTALGKR